MTGCVAITRDGRGDVWAFKSLTEADQHPLIQYGDRIVDGPKNITRRFTLSELPAILRRIGRGDLAETIQACMSAPTHRQRVIRVGEHAQHVWVALVNVARPAPSDPVELVNLIVRDRKLSIQETKKMEAETPTVATPEAEAAEAKPKRTRKPKEPRAEGAEAPDFKPKYNPDHKIRLLSNAEGVQYGPENNPKRPGSASYDRFALYIDGMTIGAAVEAGVKSADIAWDVRKGFIEIEA